MITRLLIANRGEIACRIIRTARALGIQTVAVYADSDAAALHVARADLSVPLPGTTAAETYLVTEALLDAARRSGADAVHPGYGFLAENADFARAVIAAGLIWVGPPPDAIAAMGDKLSAKRLMADAGVPILASVTDPSQAEEVGYPLIVKASAGGGGKGMRVVRTPGDLTEAIEAARREAAAAFGDDTVFLERYLDRPRHIEVQVMADAHGAVVHIGERECSIQRRHQKVIEEAPSPAVDAPTRDRLGQAAVAAARAIGYEGAGTVEFVATGNDALDFYFLEVNTRLQVEHPVTELAWRVAGGGAGLDSTPLDLVALQLQVAEGAPLPFTQDHLHLVAHAIEARLYAEDPAAGFLPATGTVEVLDPPHLPGIRWDSGIVAGDEVSPWFDAMIAKVIATAPRRTDAVRLLALELRHTRLHGVSTNRDALVALLTHPAFAAGDLHTAFIEEHLPPEVLALPPDRGAVVLHAIAAALWQRSGRPRSPDVQPAVPAGWRNNPAVPQRVTYTVEGVAVAVDYLAPMRGAGWSVTADGTPVALALHHVDPDAVDLTVEGLRATVRIARLADDGPRVRLGVDSALGHTLLLQQPRLPVPEITVDPGSLLAPMPGQVRSVAVAVGDVVVRGDVLLVLEAMKMEHRITAPNDGTVTDLRVAAGDQVQSGAVLAVIDNAS